MCAASTATLYFAVCAFLVGCYNRIQMHLDTRTHTRARPHLLYIVIVMVTLLVWRLFVSPALPGVSGLLRNAGLVGSGVYYTSLPTALLTTVVCHYGAQV